MKVSPPAAATIMQQLKLTSVGFIVGGDVGGGVATIVPHTLLIHDNAGCCSSQHIFLLLHP